MITLIFIGKAKHKQIQDSIDLYIGKINKEHSAKLNIIYEKKQPDPAKYNDYYKIALTPSGKQLTSEELAKILEQKQMQNKKIAIFIGEAKGLEEKIRQLELSLGSPQPVIIE